MKLELTDEQVVVLFAALGEYVERHGEEAGETTRPIAHKLVQSALKEMNEAEHYSDKCKFCGDRMAPGRGDFCTRICRADYGRPVR